MTSDYDREKRRRRQLDDAQLQRGGKDSPLGLAKDLSTVTNIEPVSLRTRLASLLHPTPRVELPTSPPPPGNEQREHDYLSHTTRIAEISLLETE